MKSVMISIKPKWCELIASGKKTVEVRKTRPRIEIPFKCYIYCTKSGKDDILWVSGVVGKMSDKANGKVIGKFVCDNIDTYDDDTIFTFRYEDYAKWNDFNLDRACIHPEDFQNYANGKWLYGWHISDLVIYDKPKELSKFAINCNESKKCKDCKHYLFDNDEINGYRRWCDVSHNKPIGRPFQSWGYVEEIE